MIRDKQCPGCGIVNTPCKDCPYLTRRADKLADWRPPAWPRKLSDPELDAYGHGYHDGWKQGWIDRGANDDV